MKCECCGSIESEVKEGTFKYNMKGIKVIVVTDRRYCSKCGEFVYDDFLDNQLTEKAIAEYKRLKK